jgi:hypothetical protein
MVQNENCRPISQSACVFCQKKIKYPVLGSIHDLNTSFGEKREKIYTGFYYIHVRRVVVL